MKSSSVIEKKYIKLLNSQLDIMYRVSLTYVLIQVLEETAARRDLFRETPVKDKRSQKQRKTSTEVSSDTRVGENVHLRKI